MSPFVFPDASKNIQTIPKVQQHDFPGTWEVLEQQREKRVAVPVFKIHQVLDNTVSTDGKAVHRKV